MIATVITSLTIAAGAAQLAAGPWASPIDWTTPQPDFAVGRIAGDVVTISQVVPDDEPMLGETVSTRRAEIESALRNLVTRRLMLHEAMRTLDEADRDVLAEWGRRVVVEQFGAGDLELARRTVQEREGVDLDEHAQFICDQAAITRLVNEQILSRIDVTEETARAYFDTHAHRYGPDFEAARDQLVADLRESQYRDGLIRLHERLLETGDFTPVAEMTERVIRLLEPRSISAFDRAIPGTPQTRFLSDQQPQSCPTR